MCGGHKKKRKKVIGKQNDVSEMDAFHDVILLAEWFALAPK
jgi:hypothetical protein